MAKTPTTSKRSAIIGAISPISQTADVQVVAAFIKDRCFVGSEWWSYPSDLYAAYESWAHEQRSESLSAIRFGHILTALGLRRAMAPGGKKVRLGVSPRQTS